MKNAPMLLAVGGAHIDRRGQISGDHAPGASNPGTMREEAGGGVFNAACHARNLGLQVSFLSARGGDSEGGLVARAIKAAGINDISSTFLDRRTASYTAILDRDGDVVTALADMSIYETALPRLISRRATRDAIKTCDAILADANMPAEAIRRLMALAGGKPVYVIAISPAKAVRLAGLLPKVSCLFMNAREAAALAGFPADGLPRFDDIFSFLSKAGLSRAVITNGAADAHVLDEGAVTRVAPPAALRIEDVTGAGDALAGVTVAMMMQGQGFAPSVRAGIAAAVTTIESRSAIVNLRKNKRFSELMKAMDCQKE
jgi:pseudouridine kinase